MGVRDVHLPGGWHLNTRRVMVPPVPQRGRERCNEICRRRAILPQDMREDPTFAMDSSWWDRPDDDHYDAPTDTSYHISWPLSPQEVEAEEEEIPMEEYMPLGLSEEEAIQLTIQDPELIKLSQREGSACAYARRPMMTWPCHHHHRLRRQHPHLQ
jgi:hypothetical protein